MSGSREELVARRDALIEQLQGDWVVLQLAQSNPWQHDLALTIRVCGWFLLGTVVLILALMPVIQAPMIRFWDACAFAGIYIALIGTLCFGWMRWRAWKSTHQPIRKLVIDHGVLYWQSPGYPVDEVPLEAIRSIEQHEGLGVFIEYDKGAEDAGRTTLIPMPEISQGRDLLASFLELVDLNQRC